MNKLDKSLAVISYMTIIVVLISIILFFTNYLSLAFSDFEDHVKDYHYVVTGVHEGYIDLEARREVGEPKAVRAVVEMICDDDKGEMFEIIEFQEERSFTLAPHPENRVSFKERLPVNLKETLFSG